jgi:protocatechuate 3,4-dioxygenase alpha subunit
MADSGTQGTRVSIEGTVLDGAGAPIPDALVEVWQANAAGRYNHPDDVRDLPVDPAFDGFGRIATDALGRFSFDTVKPGRVPGPGGRLQAPHIVVSLLGRGILTRLVTRVYFDDEPAANDEDPILVSCRPTGARRFSPEAKVMAAITSTSSYRARTRRCSSMCDGRSEDDALLFSSAIPTSRAFFR